MALLTGTPPQPTWCCHWQTTSSNPECWRLTGTNGKQLSDFACRDWRVCPYCATPRPEAAMSKPKPGSFMITTTAGPQERAGFLLGPFGLHNTGNFRREWKITHLKTGYVVRGRLFKYEAIDLAGRLEHLNWDFTAPPVPQEVKNAVRKIFDEYWPDDAPHGARRRQDG